MSVRIKQLNIAELEQHFGALYMAKDAEVGTNAVMLEVTTSTTWVENGNYYTQTIENVLNVTTNSKLVAQLQKNVNTMTYNELLDAENLFAHIVKIESGEGSLTLYSPKALDKSFTIEILCFN